jgi:hypothetical protein
VREDARSGLCPAQEIIKKRNISLFLFAFNRLGVYIPFWVRKPISGADCSLSLPVLFGKKIATDFAASF